MGLALSIHWGKGDESIEIAIHLHRTELRLLVAVHSLFGKPIWRTDLVSINTRHTTPGENHAMRSHCWLNLADVIAVIVASKGRRSTEIDKESVQHLI